MLKVNMHEAKTNLSKLVEKAAKGESFLIARRGKPLVKVVPLRAEDTAVRGIGFMQGEMTVPDDFKAFGRDEIEAMFGK